MTSATIDASALPGRATQSRSLLWWGMVGMMLIEGTMVGLLVATYYYLRTRAVEWPPPLAHDAGLFLPTLGLGVLLLSAVPTYAATEALKRNDRHGVFWGTFLNVVLGLAFLAVRAVEMSRLSFRWDDHAYGSIFWTILGVHTSHAIASLVESIVLLILLARGHFGADLHLGLNTDALYWYFVVGAWPILYATLYLFPRVA
jgi:cytochrome c oxidase subunit III